MPKVLQDSSRPSNELTPMTSPWPFAMWGIDLIGKLPTGHRGFQFAIVAVEYFTKWVGTGAGAEPIATITTAMIVSFVTKNIIC